MSRVSCFDEEVLRRNFAVSAVPFVFALFRGLCRTLSGAVGTSEPRAEGAKRVLAWIFGYSVEGTGAGFGASAALSAKTF